MRMSCEEALEFGNALLDAVELASKHACEVHITTVVDALIAHTGEPDSKVRITVDAPGNTEDLIRQVA